MVCRRLALASRFIAAGFSDGSVMVFHSGGSRDCIFSVKPTHEIIIGLHSRAISGLFIEEGEVNQVVFASMDGSLFEGVITARGIGGERGGTGGELCERWYTSGFHWGHPQMGWPLCGRQWTFSPHLGRFHP